MKVAIAGGGSSVGRHISEAILAKKEHDLIILSRRPLPELEQLGAQIAVVDFSSSDSLFSALTGVHTVITAISLRPDPAKAVEVEVRLIQAAEKAGAKRFIANGWAGKEEGPDDPIAVYRAKQPTLAALRASSLEWTFPMNGVFINYFATPKPGIGYLAPGKFWIDIEECKATIPGDGTQMIVYTTVEDVGELVARALDVPDGGWPQKLHIVGHRLTLNEVIKIAERIRGKPFSVKYQTEDELRSQLIPDPPSPYTNFFTELAIGHIHGRYSFEANLPEISMRFTKVDEFIEKWWGEEVG